MFSLLSSHKLILSVGTGGVGKTTVSASLAVAAAMAGKKVLVVTIDPSKRLKTALGLDDLGTDITKVNLEAKGELYASLLDPKKIFDSFIKKNAKNPELCEKIFANKLYQNISSLLAGSQEFTSLEFVLEAYESNRFDLIILDTPPSQHAIDFLRAPQRFYHLFDDKVVSWFQTNGDIGFLAKIVHSGTKKATAVLERLVGKGFLTEIYEFFSLVGSLAGTIQRRSIEAQNLLSSPEAAFCLVSSFDPIKTVEAKELYRLLKREGYSLRAVVMNRAFPFIENTDSMPKDFLAVYNDLAERFKEQKLLQRSMLEEIAGDVAYLSIPEQDFEISSLEALKTLSQSIFI
ncbi:MAG: ArsA family ATPase [Bdellovibrionales bacterium]|nr:ArsA family ATPase [Bdellovibrionales bacterium]